ncbi:radical SAM/SPASM domain-containing protein [Sporomusa acidovorans]|uniref:S-adenosyl-L-methionine-dependent 2-deoxy-scyllo-inosamine dehydrogenase n=1 Tax=Sporomusa acidovorans (strain ATCC 49682 / DSM 3132 / Mol) TaxID=1123286 RepID=A0ABZ3J6Z7_SPOA4|nr:radical SAM/SPASM domain-containing protein [Sporomusa acidovorans]OZC19328.1 S-adenosyl-L-methionine-dependent 2-deoxy-scyllo-inosamine dehydrogenase [Sporomusa acidovorans DSM 3132]SDD80618.1 radical SAM additional 4Fe4S-binding SPASM domain-containing protein [Sporomusa acidovorans]
MIINYENIVKYYCKTHLPFLYKLKEKHKQNKYRRKVTAAIAKYRDQYRQNGVYPLFTVIEIETLNRCNNTCSFCPVNKHADTREYKAMDQELFVAILEQLQALRYTGTVHLYSNNEPFLDNRIIDFAKLTKEYVPQARLKIFTNGTLLTLDKFKAIIQYLDRIVIDNYNDDLQLIPTIETIYQHAKNNSVYNDKVRIRLRKIHDVLSTRGGQAPNRASEEISSLPFGCLLPFRQMIVRPDGKISQCCNDALGKITMGDLTRESIAAIWQNSKYLALREQITQGRAGLPLCDNCDSQL